MKHAFPRLVTLVSTILLIVTSGFGTGFDAADNDRGVSYKVRPFDRNFVIVPAGSAGL